MQWVLLLVHWQSFFGAPRALKNLHLNPFWWQRLGHGQQSLTREFFPDTFVLNTHDHLPLANLTHPGYTPIAILSDPDT